MPSMAELPVVDDTALLIDAIKELAVVHGEVTLASGRKADYYVDMRRVTLDGAAAPIVGRVMRDLVADWEFEAVGGLTLGADPVATAMLHAAAADGERLDAFVVRKAGKAHGLQRLIEGSPVEGRRVLAVEDTSTTGGSVLTAVEALREAGRQCHRGRGDRRSRHRGPGSDRGGRPALPVRGLGPRSRAGLTGKCPRRRLPFEAPEGSGPIQGKEIRWVPPSP